MPSKAWSAVQKTVNTAYKGCGNWPKGHPLHKLGSDPSQQSSSLSLVHFSSSSTINCRTVWFFPIYSSKFSSKTKGSSMVTIWKTVLTINLKHLIYTQYNKQCKLLQSNSKCMHETALLDDSASFQKKKPQKTTWNCFVTKQQTRFKTWRKHLNHVQ